MASAAAIAISDGYACRRESLATTSLIKILDGLNLFDPRQGLEIYNEYVENIQKDPERGRAEVTKALKPVLDDVELTQLLVSICHTISEADGVIRDEEVDAIEEICQFLSIEPKAVKAVEIDMRDRLLE